MPLAAFLLGLRPQPKRNRGGAEDAEFGGEQEGSHPRLILLCTPCSPRLRGSSGIAARRKDSQRRARIRTATARRGRQRVRERTRRRPRAFPGERETTRESTGTGAGG